MTEPEYEAFLHTQSERKKGLEPYEGFVKSRLSKYPETSAAQMPGAGSKSTTRTFPR
jgi:hypothetical protein